MLKTIRDWLRAWLNVKDYDGDLSVHSQEIGALRAELDTEHNWRTAFVESLKAKTAAPERKAPRYTDYESSQIMALEQFKEKN